MPASRPTDKYKAGRHCTLDNTGDLYCISESREFIGERCKIVKRTKAGLIQVCLLKDPAKTFSAPQKNIVILMTYKESIDTVKNPYVLLPSGLA